METVLLLNVFIFIFIVFIYFGICDTFLGFIDKYKVKKNSIYSKSGTVEKFSNNIDLYYHCLYQFNNLKTNFFKQKIIKNTDRKLLNSSVYCYNSYILNKCCSSLNNTEKNYDKFPSLLINQHCITF